MLKDNSSGYRKNVGLIILNKKCKVLLCKRSKTDNWQFPQGGIDYTENSLKAAKRELHEEVGIKSNSIKLIQSLDEWLKYDLDQYYNKFAW